MLAAALLALFFALLAIGAAGALWDRHKEIRAMDAAEEADWRGI